MKILLIDDNPDDLEQITRALRQPGLDFTFYTATSGRDAWALLDSGETGDIDVVLIDRHLPEGIGTELSQRLRQHPRTGKASFVMITGDIGDRARAEALAHDLDGFLTKPVDTDRLRDMLVNGRIFWDILDLPRSLDLYRTLRDDDD